MKIIYVGKESSGKSLMLAKRACDLVARNSRWFEKTNIKRPIYTNSPFSLEFVKWAETQNVPIINWTDLSDIIEISEADIFIDEIIKYFDARNWLNLSLESKHWLTQGAKSGVHVYGACQDFSQVEKQFRLLCNEVYQVIKIIGSPRPMKTRPPVTRVWGICMLRQVNPSTFKGDITTMETMGWPSFFTIRKHDTDIFDTSLRIRSGKLPPKYLRKQDVFKRDENGNVTFEKTVWL